MRRTFSVRTSELLVFTFASLITSGMFQTADAQNANLDPVPSYYQDPGISLNRNYINQGFGERIDPFTGKLQFHFTDLFLPGNGGMDIKVQRSYSSGDGVFRDPTASGMGWTINFGRVLRKNDVTICYDSPASPRPVLELPDGSRQILWIGDGTVPANNFPWITQELWIGGCAPNVNGMVLFSPDGTEYDMTTSGPVVGSAPGNEQQSWYVSQMIDRNGNSLSFTYQSFPQFLGVSKVTSSDGREVDFSYDSNGVLQTVSTGGHIVRYSMHQVPNTPGYNYLDSVVLADGATTYKYYYNENMDGTPGAGSIKQATLPGGGNYYYAYSLINFATNLPVSHAVTQKTDDNGATWTYSYTPATGIFQGGSRPTLGCGDSTLDQTKIVGPDGTRLYCFVGYNSIGLTNDGGVYIYAIGTQLGMEVDPNSPNGGGTALYQSGPSIAPLAITSAQVMTRPGDSWSFASTVSAPLVTGKGTNLDQAGYSSDLSNFDAYGNAGTIAETGPRGDTRNTAVTYHVDTGLWVLHSKATETLVVNGQGVGQVSRGFDSHSNVQWENKYGVVTNFGYDPNSGDLVSKLDALGNQTTYGSYKGGIAQLENHPENVQISRSVDNYGNVVSATDGEGNTTTYQYDGMNRITQIQHPNPGSNQVAISWSPTNRTITRGNFKEIDTFDSYARQVQKSVQDFGSGASIVQNFLYDNVDRQIFASDPNASTGTSSSYDDLDRVTAKRYACANSGDQLCNGITLINYVAAGKNVTDELNLTTAYAYRSFSDPKEQELIAITPPDPSAAVAIQRNGLGQLSTVQQAGLTRSYGYNSNYFLTSVTNPETGATTYGRDAIGNMTSKQVGTAPATGFGYDGLSRLVAINYPSGTPSVTKSYYKDDKVKLVDNGVVQTSYLYDADRNLTQETVAVAGQNFVTQYGFNTNDALTSRAYPSGQAVNYAPDGFNRATAATPYFSAISYFPNGMIQSITDGAGVTTQYTQTPRLWPASMQVTGPTGNVLNSSYTYNLAGDLAQIQDSGDALQNRRMNYDGLHRLATVQGPWGDGYFTYDGQGNILTQAMGQVQQNYAYDPTTNLLTGISGNKTYSFGYDSYGDVTNNGTTAFAYDDAQQMKCANCGQSNEVDYQYDGLGMRASSTPNGSAATYFVYDHAGNLLAETTPGVSTKEYVYLQGKQAAVRTTDLTSSSTPTAATALALSGSQSSSSISVNGNVTYTLNVQNTGAGVASGIILNDFLPPQLAFVSASPGCSFNGGQVSCAVGTLAGGTSASIQVVAAATQAGELSAVANITSMTPNSSPQSAAIQFTVTAQ